MNKINNRINSIAKQYNVDINRLRAIYALERLVARLEYNDKLAQSLIYKGGFVLFKVIDTDRFTRDIDALAHGITQEEAIDNIIAAVSINDLNDGIAFGDPEVTTLDMDSTGDYGGIRIDVCFQIDCNDISKEKIHKLSRIHIDIGFGPKLPIPISKSEFPSMLPENNLLWTIYPLEFIFAEKLNALVVRGKQNSRAKDIYDMWCIFPILQAQMTELIKAIKIVFAIRGTELPLELSKVLSDLNVHIMQQAWKSIPFKSAPFSWEKVVHDLGLFLGEIDDCLTTKSV